METVVKNTLPSNIEPRRYMKEIPKTVYEGKTKTVYEGKTKFYSKRLINRDRQDRRILEFKDLNIQIILSK